MKNILTILFVFLLVQNASLVFGQDNNYSGKKGSSGKPKSDTTIFTFVDQVPKPDYDLIAYLSSNIYYPDSARAHNISGRVIVRFVVNEDGSISDVVVLRSVNQYIDAEAVRVIKNMPKWIPGKQDGKLVKVYFTQPITFELTD